MKASSFRNLRHETTDNLQERSCGIARDSAWSNLENIGPAVKQFDQLILIICPLT